MKLSLFGRSDLIRVMQAEDPELEAAVARFLGLELKPEPPPEPIPYIPQKDIVLSEPEPTPELLVSDMSEPVPFLVPVSFTAFHPLDTELEPEPDHEPGVPSPEKPDAASVALPFAPLGKSHQVLTALRGPLSQTTFTGESDIPRMVELISRGDFIERIPKKQRKNWGSSIHVIIDRSPRLVPYWDDQSMIFQSLKRLFPHEGLQQAFVNDQNPHPIVWHPKNQRGPYKNPHVDTSVIVLGDLGLLDQQNSYVVTRWINFGKRLQRLGITPVALVPSAITPQFQSVSRYWKIVSWEGNNGRKSAGNQSDATAVVEKILTLLSLAIKVEPQLLRYVRRLIPAARSDAGFESLVWQSPSFTGKHCEAASFDSQERERLMSCCAADNNEALVHKVWQLIDCMRITTDEGLGVKAMEIASLNQQLRELLLSPKQQQAALNWVQDLAEKLEQNQFDPGIQKRMERWSRQAISLLPNIGHHSPKMSQQLHRLHHTVFEKFEERLIVSGFSLEQLPPSDQPVKKYTIAQHGSELMIQHQELAFQGSLMTQISSKHEIVSIQEPLDSILQPPPWASRIGHDEFGIFAELEYKQVRQRLRWVPRGRFKMGSPADESGRYDDEGPQHEVDLSSGFWMFENPCTQELWEAVMGDNPSEFISPKRPVEQVSWDDCQEFIGKLNEELSGLQLGLPSEAQWEYACRAGTEAALYNGPIEILGQRNAPALDSIAWYGGNSGIGFDLENGYDVSDWKEKQHEFDRAGTHTVKAKHPNAWGLHDMLGNVLEWCQDWFSDDYYENSPSIDPLGPTSGSDRVARGGSWFFNARYVRCAYRVYFSPGFRSDSLGFRCVEVSQSGLVADGSGSEPGAEQGEDQSPPEIRKIAPAGLSSRIYRLVRSKEIRSKNKSEVPAKPEWSTDIGNDQFGIFAELEYKEAQQRMRWIPPGRFEMGSPADEPGRYADEVQHEVKISHGFWMFDTPCTQEFWESVMGSNPSKFNSPVRPVEQVSWEDCHEFFCTLNAKVSGITFGLPSEAQWEYACRARTKNIRYGEPNEIAWYNKNSNNQTHPVKSKLPNRWGLYDMLGNVREWCQDWYSEYYYQGSPIINPPGPVFGTNLVFRGGGWSSRVRSMRCAYRNYGEPSLRSKGLGFRCVAFNQSELVADGSGSEPSAEQVEDPSPPEARELISVDLRHQPSRTISLPTLGPITVKSDLEQVKFDVLTKPVWAHDLGRDRFGLFAELKVKQASQRLRWIPPGRFQMGSPIDEPGRYDDEGPQHEVILGNGFWMFDTPCTQELWSAVLGKNPSQFISPTRPVEQVNWAECQEFIDRLNEDVSGIQFGLPSEAQWEYACRAGSDTALYNGPLEILGENNAPALDPIAWYGGNSGLDFELETGFDASGWSEKQYEFAFTGTHPVKQKQPNVWGLYDMLGNVWEWCQDWYGYVYYQDSPAIDPYGSTSGSFRITRGGSCSGISRYLRCAYRDHSRPGDRVGNLGFRCVAFNSSLVAADGSGSEPNAEQGEDPAPPEAREKI